MFKSVIILLVSFLCLCAVFSACKIGLNDNSKNSTSSSSSYYISPAVNQQPQQDKMI